MLFSMTAFARCTREGEVGRITWEMRSVNHRYAEIYFRMPEDFRGLESDLRTILLDRLKRGKIDCNLRVEPNETTTNSLVVNQTLARSVVTAAGQIASMTVDGGAPDPMEILKWPGVLKVEKLDAQQISLEIRRAFEDAVDQLVATRRREGEKLDDLIGQRCDGIAAQVTALRTRVPEIMDLIHERYVQRLQDYLQDLDKGRVEQECALLMQKLDVAEELDRLDAHVEEVRRARTATLHTSPAKTSIVMTSVNCDDFSALLYHLGEDGKENRRTPPRG